MTRDQAPSDYPTPIPNLFAGALLVWRGPVRRAWRVQRGVRLIVWQRRHVLPTGVALGLRELGRGDVWVFQDSLLRYARATRLADAPHRVAVIAAEALS